MIFVINILNNISGEIKMLFEDNSLMWY